MNASTSVPVPAPARLTLGPLLLHWSAEKRRDFYFRIADEAPIDTVYLGEVVCSKREPASKAYFDRVADRLRAAGKRVVVSTLALVTSKREIAHIRELAATGALLEANDVATVQLLAGAPYVAGPHINVFNEGARDFLTRHGAMRIVLPVELSTASIRLIARDAPSIGIEVQVFGRQTLSVAMRCYHARSHNLTKDHCQLVCGLDADGLTASTIDGRDVLKINGTQTQTFEYGVLLPQLADLRDAGVTHFRLTPQDVDMVRVADLYSRTLTGAAAAAEALAELRLLTGDVPFANGFALGRAGTDWSAVPAM